MKPTLLILAGGLATRYGSLKQIDKIGPSGERIIDYSVYDAVKAGFGKIVYVIRKSFEEEFVDVILNKLPKEINADYVFQENDSVEVQTSYNKDRKKPWGTGHALLSAEKKINEPFVVINADDFYGYESYKIAYEFLRKNYSNTSLYALVGFRLKKTLSDYGSVSRGICKVDENNYLLSIVERTNILKKGSEIFYIVDNEIKNGFTGNEIVSMNMFAFMPSVFKFYKTAFEKFLEQNGNELQKEFYLPSVVDEIIKKNSAKVKVIETSANWFGLTYKEDKKIVIPQINKLVNDKIYPEKLW